MDPGALAAFISSSMRLSTSSTVLGAHAGALALMLASSRQMVIQDRLTREGRWDDRQHHRGREIYGKTLGVIGPGRIGAELIRICAPFRTRVLA